MNFREVGSAQQRISEYLPSRLLRPSSQFILQRSKNARSENDNFYLLIPLGYLYI
ncbi:MAG: hypothetical protein WAM22_08605 [Nitrososphaeraceae archaeon]